MTDPDNDLPLSFGTILNDHFFVNSKVEKDKRGLFPGVPQSY
jgi:hypothetical protein